jgi:adenylate cyclase
MTTILLVYVLNVVFGFFFEARSRNQLGRLFGQYVPPELVDEMSRDPAALFPGRRQARTHRAVQRRAQLHLISEAMDPAELTRMMDSFLTPLTAAVHRNKGTIDKYMGDAMMAFWGAPVMTTITPLTRWAPRWRCRRESRSLDRALKSRAGSD